MNEQVDSFKKSLIPEKHPSEDTPFMEFLKKRKVKKGWEKLKKGLENRQQEW